jgi:hypothetical protein
MIPNDTLIVLVLAGIVLFTMLVFLFIQIITQRAERRFYKVEIAEARDVAAELLDRVMAKDYHDYSVGRHIQAPKLPDAKELEKILETTEEDRQKADGLPVT